MAAGVACFQQTCDQLITGRQFSYNDAETIIQEEEYLDDIDFDDIKRYDTSRLYKKISEFNPEMNIPKHSQYSNWAPAQNNNNLKNVKKFHENEVYYGRYSGQYYNKTQILERWQQIQTENEKEKLALNQLMPEERLNPVQDDQNKDRQIARDFDQDFSNSEGQNVLSRYERSEPLIIPISNATEIPIIAAIPLLQAVRGGLEPAAGLGASMASMAMMVPGLDFLGGGGGGFGPAAALALALVPLGLTAVQTFPPYNRPRTLPAIAVIWREARNMTGTIRKREVRNLYRIIKKRSPSPFFDSDFWVGDTKVELPSFREMNYAVQKKQPKTVDILTKVYNIINRFRVWLAKTIYRKLPGKFKYIVKKIGRIEALLHKKLVCLKPRLKRRYGLLIYPEGPTVKAIKETKEDIKNFIKHGDAEDAEVEYIEDCFEDMERPRFGWRAKVTLMENEACEINFENPELSTCRSPSSSNGEPDSNYYAQSRQTGEGFRSASAADCRTEYVCDTPLNTLRRSDNFQDQQPQQYSAQTFQSQQPLQDALAPNTRRVGNDVQDQSSLDETYSLQPEQAEFTSPQPPLDFPAYPPSHVLERVPVVPSQPNIDYFESKPDEEASIQPQPNPVQSDRWLPFERDEEVKQAQPALDQTFQPQAPSNHLVTSTKQIVIQDQSTLDKTNSIESVPAPVYSPLNAQIQAHPIPDQPAISDSVEPDTALPTEPNLDQFHSKLDESGPIEAQLSTLQSDKWQAVKQDKGPVVTIATYVQGKKPSNNVYF